MSGIKLLSMKRNEEASYFYENNVPTTLDTNRNEVVEDRPPQISKKARKEEEKRSRKEKKQSIIESKKLEKEKKKSLKNSRKAVVGSVDTDRGRVDVKTNGRVQTGTHLINTGFQAGTVSNDEILNDREEDRNENEELKEEHEEASNQHVVLNKDHEGVSNGHEFSLQTHVESDQATSSKEYEISGERHANATEGHAELDSSEIRAEKTPAMEETITAEGAQHTEEAPPDILNQPKVSPEFLESTGEQHVEIEISEVTDFEADASGTYEVAAVQHGTQTFASQNGAATEGQITVAMVQQVESGVDLDGIFAASVGSEDEEDKQEIRRSVRFQEETEEIGHSEGESKDHEHASLNLGGDFSGTSHEQPHALEPAVEIVSKEERSSKAERCEVDLDDIFASAERKPSDDEVIPNGNEEVSSNNETVPKEADRVDGVRLNGSAKVNGKPKVNDLVEVELNDSNKQQNAAVKKEKRKRSGLVRCCFP